MKNLIIDATKEEVFFSVITELQSYTTTYINSRENFDKFIDLLLIFLKKYKIELKDIKKIFVNQGPGKLSSIRTSISIAKAIALSKNISLFGFNSKDFEGKDYQKILKLEKKNLLNKDLIKPYYSS
jgi:tRNA A37 threonylcarbamoyladenosine modification protein TsaB